MDYKVLHRFLSSINSPGKKSVSTQTWFKIGSGNRHSFEPGKVESCREVAAKPHSKNEVNPNGPEYIGNLHPKILEKVFKNNPEYKPTVQQPEFLEQSPDKRL